jgi:hypothetical protein
MTPYRTAKFFIHLKRLSGISFFLFLFLCLLQGLYISVTPDAGRVAWWRFYLPPAGYTALFIAVHLYFLMRPKKP